MKTALITTIIVLVIIFIICLVVSIINQNSRKEHLNSILRRNDNFSASFTVENHESRYLFCVDDNRKKILYIIEEDSVEHLLNFENIISVEIIEDSNITFTKSSTRTIGGGIVGGLIGGREGAIIGGLSGDSKGEREVLEVKVRLLLRNYSVPSIYIECLRNEGLEHNSNDLIYKCAIEEARKISDKLSVIIDLVDREERAQQIESIGKQTSNTSIADELEKLHSLKDKGVISEDEYNKLKNNLL